MKPLTYEIAGRTLDMVVPKAECSRVLERAVGLESVLAAAELGEYHGQACALRPDGLALTSGSAMCAR